MIALFGDSWARQAYCHVTTTDPMGYRHWYHKDITVSLQQNTWLHHFFQTTPSLNHAEFGNSTDMILQNLYHFENIARLHVQVNYVIFQTDPLRIFSPRLDYTDYNTVWPRLCAWSQDHNFDLETGSIDSLVELVYSQWYMELKNFEILQKNKNCNSQLFLIGGVSKIHPCIQKTDLQVMIPSVTEFFGHKQDLVFENRASLINLVKFWRQNVGRAQSNLLQEEWHWCEKSLQRKENFWIACPEYFAGRHLTAKGMQGVAEHIEKILLDRS